MIASARGQIFTILGASGIRRCRPGCVVGEPDHQVHPITRASLPALLATHRPTGHVIDCIGLTSDFRSRPLDTADAHVGIVARCLAELAVRIRFCCCHPHGCMHAPLRRMRMRRFPACPDDASDLYNITKLAGEALCLSDPRPTVRVARLSNMYGTGMPAELFLGQVLREGHSTGHVLLRDSGASAKDYVS